MVWVQWSIERVDSGEWAIFDDPEEFRKFISSELPDPVLKRIAEYANFSITLDPPRHVGNLSIQKTSDLWEKLTAGGRLCQTEAERAKDNRSTGSSFKPPIFNFHADKQNGGMMHSPGGHTTKFNDSIADSIRAKMKDCEWQQLVNTVMVDIK